MGEEEALKDQPVSVLGVADRIFDRDEPKDLRNVVARVAHERHVLTEGQTEQSSAAVKPQQAARAETIRRVATDSARGAHRARFAHQGVSMTKSPASDDFQQGYIDGWQSVKPGSVPTIPSYAIPAGKTAYEHGFELGKQAALRRR